jgi:hypothetical protein
VLNIQGTAGHIADVLTKLKTDAPIESQLNHPRANRSIKRE